MAIIASAERAAKAVCAQNGFVPCKRHAVVFTAHITASVFINDDEGGLHQAFVLDGTYRDYDDWLEHGRWEPRLSSARAGQQVPAQPHRGR